MRASKLGELPKDLLRARSRFLTWRQRGSAGRHTPPALWDLAVRLAKIHGVSRTALALGVNYRVLKKRTAAPLSLTAAGESPSPAPTFVELPTPTLLGKQCLFELNNATGTTLRVQLLGYDTADLESLARAVWSTT
jgi:hypothetical protein